MSRHVVNFWLGRALMALADLLDRIPSRKWSE